MTSLFCRHNRMTAKCPICSKELEAELRAKAPPRPAGIRRGAGGAARARAPRRRAPAALVTRKLARAEDDGYRNPLVPGLRATADAERLASALADRGRAARAARPLRGGRDRARPRAGDVARVPARARRPRRARAARTRSRPPRRASRTASCPTCPPRRPARSPPTASGPSGPARRPPASPARPTGRRSAASPRVFERLALPGFGRAPRFELLATLGAAGLYELEPDQLQLGVEDDADDPGRQARPAVGRQDAARAPRARPRRRVRAAARRAGPRPRAVGRPRRGHRGRRRAARRDALRPRAAHEPTRSRGL